MRDENSDIQVLAKIGAEFVITGAEIKNSKLCTLEFGDNQFDEIPEIVYSLSNLTHLALGNNRIKTFPSEDLIISTWPDLEYLSISYADIKKFADNIRRIKENMDLIVHWY